jgi:hypothetical protein
MNPMASPPPEPPKPAETDAARRASELALEMSRAPIGSRQRRFLRRAAERARKRAQAEQQD